MAVESAVYGRSILDHQAKDEVLQTLGLNERVEIWTKRMGVLLLALVLLAKATIILATFWEYQVRSEALQAWSNFTQDSTPDVLLSSRHGLLQFILGGYLLPFLMMGVLVCHRDLACRWPLAEFLTQLLLVVAFASGIIHSWGLTPSVNEQSSKSYTISLHFQMAMSFALVLGFFLIWAVCQLLYKMAPKLVSIRLFGSLLQLMSEDWIKDVLFHLWTASLFLTLLTGIQSYEYHSIRQRMVMKDNVPGANLDVELDEQLCATLATGLVVLLILTLELAYLYRHHLKNHTKTLTVSEFRHRFAQFHDLWNPRKIFHKSSPEAKISRPQRLA